MLNCVSPFLFSLQSTSSPMKWWFTPSPTGLRTNGALFLRLLRKKRQVRLSLSHLTFYVYGESVYLLWIRKRHENSHVSSPNCSQLCCVTNNDSHIVFKVERGLKRRHNGYLKQNAERNQTCKRFSKKKKIPVTIYNVFNAVNWRRVQRVFWVMIVHMCSQSRQWCVTVCVFLSTVPSLHPSLSFR